MRIGFVGLGKLGFPCALAIESKGHEVMGYDVSPKPAGWLLNKRYPHQEVHVSDLLQNSEMKMTRSANELVEFSEIIFVAVQTPHEEKYEGITRLPEMRMDFDYSFLRRSVHEIACAIGVLKESRIVVIVSTVLPGTLRREIYPILNDFVSLCYNPFFIAMGICVNDFLYPEFVLLGVKDRYHSNPAPVIKDFYASIHDRFVLEMSIESAELAKVAYNTCITSKIVIANTLMEICHKTPGANVDDVTKALKMATDRVVSPKYMNAGMGDGGACHPRDNIALSWLARELELSYDIYEGLMLARERQTEWLAGMIMEWVRRGGMPLVILGESFKRGSNIVTGSCSALLRNLLLEMDPGRPIWVYDPYTNAVPDLFSTPMVFFIATNHDEFRTLNYPEGSVILDPWGYIPDIKGSVVVRIGRK